MVDGSAASSPVQGRWDGSLRRRYRPYMAGRVVPGSVAAVFVVVLAFHSGGYFASEWGLVALVFLLAAVTALLVADSLAVRPGRGGRPAGVASRSGAVAGALGPVVDGRRHADTGGRAHAGLCLGRRSAAALPYARAGPVPADGRGRRHDGRSPVRAWHEARPRDARGSVRPVVRLPAGQADRVRERARSAVRVRDHARGGDCASRAAGIGNGRRSRARAAVRSNVFHVQSRSFRGARARARDHGGARGQPTARCRNLGRATGRSCRRGSARLAVSGI